ncbi:protein FAF-like, chloroplastic [Oryza glaberrima]|uniref:FAF domain-containing protein n=1 Tax=Oryza glaberrima TaxID=4538 RepID=I1R467_ORYGL|nr:protein FAF-like, chloroplastic [Oryza glaberrima]
MAADGGALRRLFEKPLPVPENPTLLEALSACNHVHHRKKLVDPASFTEIFGELHFQEKPVDVAAAAAARFLPPPPPVRAASWVDVADDKSKDDSSLDALLRPKSSAAAADVAVKRSASFCLKSSESSLLLCTEGLGTESTVDADDMVKDGDGDGEAIRRGEEETDGVEEDDGAGREKRGTPTPAPTPTTFPPPIRSIGRGGKPCVCFRSFRAEGRFVLMEVVIPGKELLQATREGGRLTLRFANAAAAAAVGGGVVEAHDDVNDDDVDR